MVAVVTMSESKEKPSCIQLSHDTKNKLAEMGGKNDSYEDIVIKLMNFKKPLSEDISEINSGAEVEKNG